MIQITVAAVYDRRTYCGESCDGSQTAATKLSRWETIPRKSSVSKAAEPRLLGRWLSATARNCTFSIRENCRHRIFDWPLPIVCTRFFPSCQSKLIAPVFFWPVVGRPKIDNHSLIFARRFGQARKSLLEAIVIPVSPLRSD